MRLLGYALSLVGVGFGLAGLFFGRASWLGLNGRSVPTWVLLEIAAFVFLALGLGIRFSRVAQ